MSINFRLHATLWESSAKLKTPSPALIRHIKHSFSFEINLIIRYAKGSNCKFQLPITFCHYQLFLTDIGPEVNIQEGFQIRGTCMMVSSLLATTAHSVALGEALRYHSLLSVSDQLNQLTQVWATLLTRALFKAKITNSPSYIPFTLISETFGARAALPPFPKLLTDISFLKMIAFIQVKFAANTDVWAHGRVCPAARDGMKS